MPEISRFFGIVVLMFINEHGKPHFHARYENYMLSMEIESGKTRGKLPPRALKLVDEWRLEHKEELLENWNLLRSEKSVYPIAPLE